MSKEKNNQTTTKGDPNFNIITRERDGLVFRNVRELPVLLTGFPFMEENGDYNRVPNRIMPALPEQLQWVAVQPSGGMIHFRTNAKRLSLEVELLRNESSIQCAQNCLSGFDVYIDSGEELRFAHNLNVNDNPMKFTADLPSDMPDGIKEIKIYTPLQNPIKDIFLGVEKDAEIYEPTPFDVEKPILFYGSSITCGFCASRPGLSYPAQITRALNAELINFGFGGGARGEKEIAETIASLDLSCLVIDYDCNAPSPEFLWDTHYPFFEIIRKARPDLPIIIVSGPFYWKHTEYNEIRKRAIEETYRKAFEAGDRKTTFIDGGKMFPYESWEDCTTDRLHPNDLGFSYMRKAIEPVVRFMLNK